MPKFKALDGALDGDALELPIPSEKHPDGRVYRIPDPPADLGMRVSRLVTGAIAAYQTGAAPDTQLLDDQAEGDIVERLLGPALVEMRADGVRWSMIRHAGMTAMMWVALGEDAAAAYWESGSGGRPGEATPAGGNRASRRASEAAARRTLSQASTNGMRGSQRRRRAK